MTKAKTIPALNVKDIARLYSNVEDNSSTECHEWVGSLNDSGYGVFYHNYSQYKAHRVVYSLNFGDPGENLVIDHLCRNRSCVNPAHLEAVSSQVNTLRGIGFAAKNALKGTCPRGHALIKPNHVSDMLGTHGRSCRSCDNASRMARRRSLEGSAREVFIKRESDKRYKDYLREAARLEVEMVTL